MTRREQLEQLRRMEERLAKFADFTYLPPTAKYVGLKNDGEVCLEEIPPTERTEEDVR